MVRGQIIDMWPCCPQCEQDGVVGLGRLVIPDRDGIVANINE